MEIWTEKPRQSYFLVGRESGRGRISVPAPSPNLVVLVHGVEDDQRRVAGDLELGVGDGRSVVHQHHDVLGLGAHGGHVHRSAGTRAKHWDHILQNTLATITFVSLQRLLEAKIVAL